MKDYVAILKLFKRKKVNLLATDSVGRNCFHHAAGAGNTLGLQFTIGLLKYHFEMDNKLKVDKTMVGQLPTVQWLVRSQSIGGVTPLMRAAESCDDSAVFYLLSIGADPLQRDNRRRTAR